MLQDQDRDQDLKCQDQDHRILVWRTTSLVTSLHPMQSHICSGTGSGDNNVRSVRVVEMDQVVTRIVLSEARMADSTGWGGFYFLPLPTSRGPEEKGVLAEYRPLNHFPVF